MKRASLCLLTALLVVFLSVSCFAWWDTGWDYRKKITVKTTDANLARDITNDQVILIDVNSNEVDFWSHVDAQADDVRFVAADDTTELDFYLQYFEPTDQNMIAWIRVTDTFETAANMNLYLYYGNGASARKENPASVLSDYNVVWHFDENISTVTVDATADYNALTSSANIWDDGNTWLGTSALNSQSTYYADQNTLWNAAPEDWTIKFWFMPTIDFPMTAMWFLTSKQGNNAFSIRIRDDTNTIQTGTNACDTQSVGHNWDAGIWHQIMVSYDNSETDLNIYVDGIWEGENTGCGPPGAGVDDFTVGAGSALHDSLGEVVIDEFSIIGKPMSEDEAHLNFENENFELIEFGAEEESAVAGTDLNIVAVEGYDLINDVLPVFTYIIDGNLTIDFNVWNVDNNRIRVDINYSTSSAKGTGTPIVKDLNLTTDVCTDQDFTTISNCSWDWNIAFLDNNYYILMDANAEALGDDPGLFVATTKTIGIESPSIKLQFWDENTYIPIKGLSVANNGTTYTTDSDGIIDLNLAVTGSTTYEFEAWEDSNYGRRFFEFDINNSTELSVSLYMLRDVNGFDYNFQIYESDETTLQANERLWAYDENMGVCGIVTANASGKAGLFLNPDENYIYITEDGTVYTKVDVNVAVPKDEDSLSLITPYNVLVSGLANQKQTGLTESFGLMFFPNTIEYYIFDFNGGANYYARQYEVNVKGNPATYDFQPYLSKIADSGDFIFYVVDSTTLNPLPGVQIKIERTIPGEGTVVLQTITTDSAGTASIPLLIDITYDVYFYYSGNLLHTTEIRPTLGSLYYQVGLNITEIIVPVYIPVGRLDANFLPSQPIIPNTGNEMFDINATITLVDKNFSTMLIRVMDTNFCVYDSNNFLGTWADGNGVYYHVDINAGTSLRTGLSCAYDSRYSMYMRIDVNTVDGNTFSISSMHYNIVLDYEYSLWYRLAILLPSQLNQGGIATTNILAVIITLLAIGSMAVVGVHDPAMLAIFANTMLGFFVWLGWFALTPFIFIAVATFFIIVLTRSVLG